MTCRSSTSRSTSREPHASSMRPSHHRTRSPFPPQKPTSLPTAMLLLRLLTSRRASRPPPRSRHLYLHLRRDFNRHRLRLPPRVSNERRECWCTAARASREALLSCWRISCCAHASRRRRLSTRSGSCARGAACVRTTGFSHSSCCSIGVCTLRTSGTRGTLRSSCCSTHLHSVSCLERMCFSINARSLVYILCLYFHYENLLSHLFEYSPNGPLLRTTEI